MFNLAAVAETCCDLEITYNTSVVKKTNWAKFAYSNGDAATVCQSLNGKTQDVYYKDEDPDKLIMKQRSQLLIGSCNESPHTRKKQYHGVASVSDS